MDFDTPNLSFDLPIQPHSPQHRITESSYNPTLAGTLPLQPGFPAATGFGTLCPSPQSFSSTFSPQVSAFTNSPNHAHEPSGEAPFEPQIVKLANTTNPELLFHLSMRRISPQYLATLDIHIEAEIRANTVGTVNGFTTMKAHPLELYYTGSPLAVYLRAVSTCKSLATYTDAASWSVDGKEVQKLSGCEDAELLAYMVNNNILPHVLVNGDLTITMNEQNMRAERVRECRPVLWGRKLALAARNANPIDLLKFLMYHSYTTTTWPCHGECYLNHPRAVEHLQGDHLRGERARIRKNTPKASSVVPRKMSLRLLRQRRDYRRREQDSGALTHDLLDHTVKEEEDINSPERRALQLPYEETKGVTRVANRGRKRKQQKLQLNRRLELDGDPKLVPIRNFNELTAAGDRSIKLEEISRPWLENSEKKTEQDISIKKEEKDVFIKEEETDDHLLVHRGVGSNIKSEQPMMKQRKSRQPPRRHRSDGQAELRATNHTRHKHATKTAGIAELTRNLVDLNQQVLTLQASSRAKRNKYLSVLKQEVLITQIRITKAEGKISERDARESLQNYGQRVTKVASRVLSCLEAGNRDASRKLMIMRQEKEVEGLTGKLAHLTTQNA